jgi:hypothetical protein
MFAIKRPIKDLESKPWPEYDLSQLLSDEQRGLANYHVHYKINGKDIE